MSVTSQLTLRQVEAFLAVAREQHFGRAAESLHVSAPHLSQTIKQLEHAVGCELFARTTRSVQLTSAGGVFAASAERAMSELDRAVVSARNAARTDHTELRLGYTIGAGLDVVPTLLRNVARQHQEVSIHTEEYDFSEPTAGLRDHQVHAAIVRPPIGLAGLVSVDLVQEARVACLPDGHPLAQRDSVSVADLLSEPIIAAPQSLGPWRDYWILSEFRASPAPVVAEAPTFEAELHLVASGRGISVTGSSAAHYYRRPGVTFVPIHDLAPCTVVLAWWPEDTPAVAPLVTVASQLDTTR